MTSDSRRCSQRIDGSPAHQLREECRFPMFGSPTALGHAAAIFCVLGAPGASKPWTDSFRAPGQSGRLSDEGFRSSRQVGLRASGAPGARTQNPRIKSPLLYH
jgi:hypothetical protein